MTVRKFNYKKFIIFIAIVILIIIGIVIGIKKAITHYNYTKSYEYKLLSIGYDEDEVKTLIHKLNESKIDEILNRKANSNIVSLVNEKYLEKQLNSNSSINSWDDFLNRANIQYIWMVLNPLDDTIDFNAEEGLINRNNI